MKLLLLFALVGVSAATLRVQTNPTHYGDPATGCQSDEQPVQITGVAGDVCTPQCDATSGQCPTDVPDGVTATPTCALQTTAGAKYCALLCSPSDEWDALRAGDAQCGQATCKAIQSVGICTYDDVTKSDFESWRLKHGYANLWNKDAGEYQRRLSTFTKNMAKIAKHNAEGHEWTMKMNEFGHLTSQEFTEQYTGYAKQKISMDVPRTPFVSRVRKEDLADSVDWTTKGAVTPVKNQGSCGSCWSFSTTGGMEGSYFVKNGNLVSFSEQQLVSCDKVDSGCNGGLMDNAFKWVEGNGGLCSEADYPYTSGSGSTGTCKSSCTAVTGSTISSFTDVSPSPQVTPATQAKMEAAVAQQPISVAIEADQSAFQFYSSGVMTGTCGTSLDHGVLVVGYGTSGGTDYWKIKNSWGASWGMNGYILIQRGKSQKGGQCGVLLAASYPNF